MHNNVKYTIIIIIIIILSDAQQCFYGKFMSPGTIKRKQCYVKCKMLHRNKRMFLSSWSSLNVKFC